MLEKIILGRGSWGASMPGVFEEKQAFVAGAQWAKGKLVGEEVREREWADPVGRASWTILRALVFPLNDMDSHWRTFSSGMLWPDLWWSSQVREELNLDLKAEASFLSADAWWGW